MIENLGEVKDEIVEQLSGSGSFPLFGFLFYYLNARDSVALAALESTASALTEEWKLSKLPENVNEIRKFWLIAGLLEAGLMTTAESVMRDFRPKDRRLLLGIYLGCHLIQQIRFSTAEQKKSAQRISKRIEESVSDLRREVIEEFKTQLLEVRRGEIVAVPEDNQKQLS